MNNTTLLEKIGELLSIQTATLRKEIKQSAEQVKKELREEIKEAVKESQKDTINVMTQIFYEGFGMHEKRIKRVEDHLHLTPME